MERTVITSKSEGDHSQEGHHSIETVIVLRRQNRTKESHSVNQKLTKMILPQERLRKVNWPMNSKEWKELDEDLEMVLETSLKGSVEMKLETLAKIVYAFGKERFGLCQEKCKKAERKTNRREKEIKGIRRELRQIAKQFRKCAPEEEGLNQLRDALRIRLKDLRKAERIKRAKKEKERKRAAFIQI